MCLRSLQVIELLGRVAALSFLHSLPFFKVSLFATLGPSFLQLSSTTNHYLFTTPRAHSTTLLAPIADLFIPDNVEGGCFWVYIPQFHCLCSVLVRLNWCTDDILSQADLFRSASVKWSWDLFYTSHTNWWQRRGDILRRVLRWIQQHG